MNQTLAVLFQRLDLLTQVLRKGIKIMSPLFKILSYLLLFIMWRNHNRQTF